MSKKPAPSRRKRAAFARSAGHAVTAGDLLQRATGSHVIMLDNLLTVYPTDFPITAQATDVAVLRAIAQHDGRYFVLPRQAYGAEFLENKDLINAASGRIDHGGIYRITARQWRNANELQQ